MNNPRVFLLVAFPLCLLLSAGSASAGNVEEARAYHEKASAAFGLGRYADAAESFEKAFELKPDPAELYNAAQAHRLAGNKQRALTLYQNYLRMYGAKGKRNEAEAHVRELKAAIERETPADSPAPAKAPIATAPAPVPANNANPEPPAPAPPSPSPSPSETASAAAQIPPAPPPAPAQPAAAPPAPIPTLTAPPPAATVTLASGPTPPPEESRPLTRKPWFWAVVGGGVIAAAAVVLLLTLSGTKDPTPSLGHLP